MGASGAVVAKDALAISWTSSEFHTLRIVRMSVASERFVPHRTKDKDKVRTWARGNKLATVSCLSAQSTNAVNDTMSFKNYEVFLLVEALASRVRTHTREK